MTEIPLAASTTEQGFSIESSEIPRHRIPVLIAGLTGKMGTLIGGAIEQNGDFELVRFALSSENHHFEWKQIGEKRIFLATTRSWPNDLPEGTIVVDYTNTASVEGNAEFYIAHGLPFVMGTSVGNKERLQRLTAMVENSNISAVIAANMDPGIVRRGMEIDQRAAVNPGIFIGATVKIVEIHQPSKVTAVGTPITSGTAIAFRDQYEKYGALPNGEILSIRDQPDSPMVHEAFGDVTLDPEKGYAYHHVVVIDRNGNVIDDFETRAIGRGEYVKGTLMATKFLPEQIRNGSRRHVHSMVDVLNWQGGDTNG